MSKMRELTEQLLELSKEITEESKGLANNLSTIDREVNDLYHFIEINDLSASAGYKAYKDLQDCLRRRRVAKDDLELANILAGTKTLSMQLGQTEALAKVRTYVPRVREDLFPTEESKTTYTGQFIAVGIHNINKGKQYVLNTLDDAVALVIKQKGENFQYTDSRVKAKIQRAAKQQTSYDGWLWKMN